MLLALDRVQVPPARLLPRVPRPPRMRGSLGEILHRGRGDADDGRRAVLGVLRQQLVQEVVEPFAGQADAVDHAAFDFGDAGRRVAVAQVAADRLGQGREQSMNFLREHVELTQSIEERIRLHFGLIPQSGDEPAAPAEPAPKGGEPYASRRAPALTTGEVAARRR